MEKYSKLILDLSWNNNIEVQEKAISELVNIEEDKLALLVMPNGKDCWENAAKVIT